jgi:hypothetical protein
MKAVYTLCLLLLIGAGSAFAQTGDQQQKKDGPAMTFKEEQHDFGKVTEGVQAEYIFTFTNTGNQPLILKDVHASCGCTTPTWTREPVLPGKTGIIKVSYNSQGRPGVFNKSVTITSNIPDETKILFIKGEVTKGMDGNGQNPNNSPVRIGN